MAEDTDALLTAEQYREQARLCRQKAAAMVSRLARQGLLDGARQYEKLAEIADSIERTRSSG